MDENELDSMLESAFAEHHGAQGAESKPETEGSQNDNPTEEGSEDASESRMIGLKDEDQPQERDKPEGKLTLSEGIAPESVVALDESGKPVTANELLQGHLRQADYTRKTQEIAEYRKTAEPAVQFVSQNWEIIEKLGSPDQATKLEAIRIIAESNGVDLGSLSPQRGRGPDGRFVSQAPDTPEDGLIDLSEWEPGDPGYELARRYNDAITKNQTLEKSVSSIEAKLDSWVKGQETAQQKAANEAALSALAKDWQTSGLKDIDLQAASGLIGKPLTPEQAMVLSHFEAILAHNAATLRAKLLKAPNEAGDGTGRGVTPDGMSLDDYFEAMHGVR